MPRKKKKLSLDEAAMALTRIAEQHLSRLSEEEQESRVAAFSRVNFKKKARGIPSSPKTSTLCPPRRKGWRFRFLK
jgi:hypothetical protein